MTRTEIDAWDPTTGDLSEEAAALLDRDADAKSSFDARFAPAELEGLDDDAIPSGLAERVLPPAHRRWPWVVGVTTPVLLAASALVMTLGADRAVQLELADGRFLTVTMEEDVASRDQLNIQDPRATQPTTGRAELTRSEFDALVSLGYIDPKTVTREPASPDRSPMARQLEALGYITTADDALSTFGVDVDTGAYTLARRLLREGHLPAVDQVRVEEFVNAQTYDYPRPATDRPLGVHTELVASPWSPDVDLVRVGVQARRVAWDDRKPAHLTFLVDTSGSMMGTDRLDLVRFGLRTLLGQLRDGDSVAIVTYSGSAGVVLPPTSATDRSTVLAALDRLSAGGSTAMGAGIDAAYRLAHEVYEPGAINRVILCSDGDANVGLSGDALLDRIAREAGTGVALTTVGVGTGNLRDGVMEQLADRGDGVYVYLDSEKEARRVFADRLLSTLQTVARDVKIQVEWDPDAVEAWTLLGYENRAIADRDFRDDAVDAGEVGAGHQVTALYAVKRTAADSHRLGTVRMRYEAPGPEAPAVELEHPIAGVAVDLAQAHPDTRIAVAAATLAEKLRERPWASRVSWRALAATVEGAIRPEYADDDRELLELVRRAAELRGE